MSGMLRHHSALPLPAWSMWMLSQALHGAAGAAGPSPDECKDWDEHVDAVPTCLS